MKSRIAMVFAGFVLLWGALLTRGAFLQFIPNAKLEHLRARQFETMISLQDRRGPIVDRYDRELAISTRAFSLYADPHLLKSKKAVAKKLGKILALNPAAIYQKIKDSDKRFIWISRLLPASQSDLIRGMKIRGLELVEEFRRIYPNDSLFASSLGTVGMEGQGLEGVELAFDEKLRGNHRRMAVRRDARGRPLFSSDGSGLMFSEAVDGGEIKLTIDSSLQYKLELELAQAVKEFEADQAFGVILQAQTSEILALANTPQFDANMAAKMSNEVKRNRTIADTFEPGSTLKTFVLASALQEHLVAPNTKINTENGHFMIGKRMIKEAEARDKWESLSVSEVLAYSSNIGTSKIALMMGDQKLRQGLSSFGFGVRTGLNLPGEAHGSLQPLPWHSHLLANISFGQGISVTPLQLANAYATIANGGILRTPTLLMSYRDPETGEITPNKPPEGKRILSAEVATQMRLMLTGVTAPGATGVNAKVDGFLVAGKTGTAQKVKTDGRGYLPDAYVSSFAGFIPANDPKFVIYVVVDHPKKKNTYYGSQVAAPLFSRIAGYAVREAGLAPSLLSERNLAEMTKSDKKESTVSAVSPAESILNKKIPKMQNLTVREILQQAKERELKVKWIGQGGRVDRTEPEEGQPLPDNHQVNVFMKNE